MAKAKKNAAPHTRALDHDNDAAGLAAIREGIGVTPEDDRLLALGWPHLRYLVDGHRDDKDAQKSMLEVLKSLEGHYGDVWPAEVASRYVRAFGTRTGVFSERSSSVMEAIAVGDVEVDEASARDWLAASIARSDTMGQWFVEHFVLLLEAFVGPDVVLEGVVSSLETLGDLDREEEASYIAYTTGYLMLRVVPDTAEDARRRLEAVRDARGSGLVHGRLLLVLGGGQAAKDRTLNPNLYHHVTDDPEAILAAVQAGKWLPSVRLVQLGGEQVLEAFAPHWRRHRDREPQLRLVAELAKLRSPLATKILEEMADKSKVKKQAAAALESRP